ncbi:Xanthine and CO dehydrogenase maturation factor, XdhC/CoxF family [Reichenbachiella faecimaris]|uniref:Xanthine and CO dehydrogenase maturation factor, XdhC/CoxF family n=1 Tax=Reichenbachiella faecimaris TaxID=692418 RepID=A0A1W2G6Z8_REIFA|nr:XdhC/CoxI family protein [Reichenbachiella faecimaris]SMD32393.1 Xanthine and CO dehydrogenase maturation factor, XdhC/CoxF family [Reichenbachiella faecimaris]
MKEFKTILEAYHKIDFNERKVALATVVQVKGSSYRSPGARMLMLDNGRWVGSISGGCLEGDALRKARQVILSGEPRTVTYDTSNDDDNQLGIGLGCNGIIDIIIEPIDPNQESNPITNLETFLNYGGLGASATVFESSTENIPVGSKVDLNDKQELSGASNELQQLLIADLHAVVENQKPEIKSFEIQGEKIKVFFELIQPGIDLLIFGGGFDAKPVTELAHVLGWNVRVTDECVAHLVPINFPLANQLQSCKREFVQKEIKITPFTAVVLMSHNLKYDEEVMRQIINSDAPYIGILGPKKRAEKIFKTLKDKYEIDITSHQLDKIHAPIGLDIGAETPDEIAVSIISEIQAKFSNRSGGFIKYRTGPIHHRDGKEDQVFRQVYLKNFFPKQKSN